MSSPHIKKISHSYSLYVARNRGIPSIIDGLKHGQRMALWMLRNKSGMIKTMALTGSLLAEKIYVHGDAACNSAISLLAGPYRNNVPLITGDGFFGSRVAPSSFGAARYTSVARSSAAVNFLYNDLPLIPLCENYDGSAMEPEYFLPLIPIVLLNGVSGVAVGFSTDILPRSLPDLIQATQNSLKGKKYKEIDPYYNNYDLGIKKIGPSQWELSGKVTVRDSSTLIVTELPPSMALENFKKRLIQMEEKNLILDFQDNSSNTINIEVKMARGSVKNWTEDQALDLLKLREKATERLVVVDFDCQTIRQYDSPEEVINAFTAWRLEWYEKRYARYHQETSDELVYWKLLAALFASGFTKKLGTFQDRASMETEVLSVAKKAKIELLDGQLEKAMGLPTYRWTRDFEADVNKKIAELEAQIADYSDILAKPERRRDIYIAELENLKKLK